MITLQSSSTKSRDRRKVCGVSRWYWVTEGPFIFAIWACAYHVVFWNDWWLIEREVGGEPDQLHRKDTVMISPVHTASLAAASPPHPGLTDHSNIVWWKSQYYGRTWCGMCGMCPHYKAALVRVRTSQWRASYANCFHIPVCFSLFPFCSFSRLLFSLHLTSSSSLSFL